MSYVTVLLSGMPNFSVYFAIFSSIALTLVSLHFLAYTEAKQAIFGIPTFLKTPSSRSKPVSATETATPGFFTAFLIPNSRDRIGPVEYSSNESVGPK
jgi:hypothetical protein